MSESDHRADKFVIVYQTDDVVVLHAMCKCGDDNCGFSANSYKDQWFRIEN